MKRTKWQKSLKEEKPKHKKSWKDKFNTQNIYLMFDNQIIK